ncbi:phage integrase family protein [Mucilaginibacter gracilis]|uniref:Phage integrase family protein n=1 Tax=Mucilaginibacter gracilis TaxID=423350 RepID=A0A495J084_9SPHI|nr:site-specific integrase [Mucilaginibacter gracilis]RKR82041.1 phage integrase family protein [Mucilaginibacter gracilis]
MTKTFNFTISELDKLPIPAKGNRSYHKDTQVRGLFFAIQPSGAKSFYVIKKIAGRTEKIFLGKYPDLTIENARKLAKIKLGQIAMGINPQNERRKIRNEMNFGQLFDQYLHRYSKVHKKSWLADQQDITRFVPHWFKRKISDIKRPEIKRLHETIYRDHGLYQANKMLQRIRAIYNKATEWGWEGNNPTTGIKKYKEKSRDRFILPAELPFILQAINDYESETVRDYLWMLFLTGARRTNTLMMRYEQINWEYCEWRIPDTKNGDPVTVPLMPRAMEILQRRFEVAQSQWVFPKKGDCEKHTASVKTDWQKITERATLLLWQQNEKNACWLDSLGKRMSGAYDGGMPFKQIIKQAESENFQLPQGVTDIRLHDIRRTFGSYQAISGASLSIIGKSLGHKSSQATEIYARLNLDPVRASVETATNLFLLQPA